MSKQLLSKTPSIQFTYSINTIHSVSAKTSTKVISTTGTSKAVNLFHYTSFELIFNVFQADTPEYLYEEPFSDI